MGSDEESAEVELAPSGAARRARAVVDRIVATMPGDLRFRARVAVSELVTNSVAHAAGARDDRLRLLVVRTRAGVRVEVRDGGEPFDSEARVVSEHATSGRGLRLVDGLVDRWGADPADGNLIWFEIDRPAGGDRDPGTTPTFGRTVDASSGGGARDEETLLAAAILAKAAQRIREGWCQGADAVDAVGNRVQPWSEDVAAWSLLGALVAALDGPDAVGAGNLPQGALGTAMLALGELIEERSLAGWNDAPSRTQQDAIDVLERGRMLVLSGRVAAGSLGMLPDRRR